MNDALSIASAHFTERRAGVELDLAGAILADPAAHARVAAAAGFHVEHVDADDVRIILLALRVKRMLHRLTGDRHTDALAVAVLARGGLRDAGFWDDEQIAGNFGSGVWSDASLAVLLDGWPPCPSMVRHLVHQHAELHRRERAAADHLADAMALLTREPAPLDFSQREAA